MEWLGSPRTKISWEPCGNLPVHVVTEYESGDRVKVVDKIESSYGKRVHTATVVASQEASPKKPKMSASVEADSG